MRGNGGKSFTGFLLVVLGLTLAVCVSWPLVRFLSSAIPYTSSAKQTERVAGLVPGDHLQYLYHLNLLREALDGKISPFSNPYEFAGPYRWDTPYIYFPFAVVYAAFSYVTPAFGYNMLVLLSFVGTMAAGYGLARAWGANRGGAVCTGTVLTLFPHRLNSLFGGHAAGSAFFLFPMAWWGLEKSWQTGRVAWGLMVALCLVVMGIEDAHHLFFFCLLLPFWAFWKLLDQKAFEFPERTRAERPKGLSAMSWQAVAAAVLLAASFHFNLARARAIPLVSLTFLGLLVFFCLVVLGVILLMDVVLRWLGVQDGPFKRKWLSWPWVSLCPLLGYFAADYVNRPRFGSNLVLASLFVFALCHLGFLVSAVLSGKLSWGKTRVPWKRVLKLTPAAVGLMAAVIYPLYLKVAVFARSAVAGGRPLFEVRLYSVPFQNLFARSPEKGTYVGWAFTGLVIAGAIALLASRKHQPSPEERRRLKICYGLAALGMVLACGLMLGNVFPLYNILFRLIPFLNYIRSTAKYLVLTATGGAVALALLLTLLTRHARSGVAGGWLSVAVATVLIVDFGLVSRVGVSVLPKRSATYEVVRSQAKGTRLVELPIWPGDSAFSSAYQYGTMLTGVPTINGYSPAVPIGYMESISDPLYPLNFGMLRQSEFDLLKSLNVRFINFRQDMFPRKVSPLPVTHSLKRLLLNPNLQLVTEEGGAYLFKMQGEAYKDISGMPCDRGSSVLYYIPYDLLMHQVGEEKADEQAIRGKAWSAGGTRGFSFFGPFLMLPPGDYVAVFRVKVEAPRGTVGATVSSDDTPRVGGLPEIGYLDVLAESTVLAKHELNPSDWPEPHNYRFVEIPFAVAQPRLVQTRGFLEGDERATLGLDFVLIKTKEQGENIHLEAEDFFSTVGWVMKDDKATEGICLRIGGLPPPGQPILEESFVFLMAGRYRVECSARGQSGKIATLRVRRVAATDEYKSFDVLGREGQKEFTVSQGILNLTTGGVHGVSLWPAGNGLESVDCISFSVESKPQVATTASVCF